MRRSTQSTTGRSVALRLLAGASMLCILATLGSVQPVDSAQETGAQGAAGATNEQLPLTLSSRAETKDERYKKLDATKLRRLDFRVTGSGCASCLGRIRKRMDKLKGVGEVAAAIKPPYGVAVIYDSTKTNKDEIIEAARKDEKVDVVFKDFEDVAIEKQPLILIPKFNSLTKAAPTQSD